MSTQMFAYNFKFSLKQETLFFFILFLIETKAYKNKKLISAERSEAEKLMEGHFSWGKKNKISVEDI